MNDSITNEIVLDKKNKEHQALVECMDSALYEIWEYSKAGNIVAHDFMHSMLHDALVQFELDFMNTDITQLNSRATYGTYRALMAEVIPLLNNLRKESIA